MRALKPGVSGIARIHMREAGVTALGVGRGHVYILMRGGRVYSSPMMLSACGANATVRISDGKVAAAAVACHGEIVLMGISSGERINPQMVLDLLKAMDVEREKQEQAVQRHESAVVQEAPLQDVIEDAEITEAKPFDTLYDSEQYANYAAEPSMVEPQMVEPQMAMPQMVEPQKAQPQMVKPQMLEPKIAEPQMVQPQMAEPQMVEPQMVKPKMVEPQMAQSGIQENVPPTYERDLAEIPGLSQHEIKKAYLQSLEEYGNEFSTSNADMMYQDDLANCLEMEQLPNDMYEADAPQHTAYEMQYDSETTPNYMQDYIEQISETRAAQGQMEYDNFYRGRSLRHGTDASIDYPIEQNCPFRDFAGQPSQQEMPDRRRSLKNAFARVYPMLDWEMADLPDGGYYLFAQTGATRLFAIPNEPGATPPAGLPARARYMRGVDGKGYWVF